MPPFRCAAVTLLLAVFCGGVPSRAQYDAGGSPESPPVLRVRAVDEMAARLLADGFDRSQTIHGLVTALEHRDVIVFVETGFTSRRAQLTLVGSAAGTRFLRITLGVPEAEDRLLALLGHELQHVLEVAQAPEVRTAEDLRALYLRIGHGVSANGVCTIEAQHTGEQVALELALGPAPAPALK